MIDKPTMIKRDELIKSKRKLPKLKPLIPGSSITKCVTNVEKKSRVKKR